MAFGGGRFDDNSQVMSEINMTPLVDVMLVLLIVFMLTVPVLTHSVKVDLPQASSRVNEVPPATVHLAISADGQLYWNEQLQSEDQLAAQLAQAAHQQPQPQIQLNADRKVAYERVAQVMAAAQRAGVVKLGFVTLPGK
ncbi:ExbD/TolR family protein [Chitinimonas sp.]|uniref:ExbD/TolR family protein n=1 Tax=Chitinimonas sp. TaxID=1934313 RepID=UPI0035AF3AF0